MGKAAGPASALSARVVKSDRIHANLREGSRGQVADRCISHDGSSVQAVSRAGTVCGTGISKKAVWYVVRSCARRLALDHLALMILGALAQSSVM